MALRFYVNGLSAWRDEIRDAFADQVARLGIGTGAPQIFEDDDPALPERAVVLYLSDGPQAQDDDVEASLRAHIDAGRAVIPVLDDLADATDKLPECLHDFNAYAVGTEERSYDRLIDEIVTRLWLRRSVRKIFLSYKRSDSSTIAHQLRDKLTRRAYNVFLDECKLSPGVAVQREIFWELNDADLVLLLCSPDLGQSKWVMDEIAAANATLLPILGVVWPRCKPPGSLYPDQKYELEATDFVNRKKRRSLQELTLEGLDDLLGRVETFRTEAVQQRLVNLLPYVRAGIKPKLNPRDAASIGDLELDGAYLRVLPFRPTVNEAYDLHREISARKSAPRKAFLFYPENDPNDRRRVALDWVFKPERAGGSPQSYRLLSYLGDGDADLGELAP